MLTGYAIKLGSLRYGLICTASLLYYQKAQYYHTFFICFLTIIRVECYWLWVKIDNSHTSNFQSQISQENQDFKVPK